MATIETIHRSLGGSHDLEAEMTKERNRPSITSALNWVETMFEKRRSRRALLEMSDDQLKDIGLSRGEAYHEANRGMWI